MKPHTLVIAEAGVNHNGSIETALALVDAAASGGADVVKFQSFRAEKLVTVHAPKADYQVSNTGEGGSQLAMLAKLELRAEDHAALLERAKKRGIRFMSTGFDAENLAFLATLDMPAIKIPSGDITCAPLLLQAAQFRQKLIVSTGMSTLEDIENALGVIAFGLTHDGAPRGRADCRDAYASRAGRTALSEHVTLLHCVTQYPAPPEAVNLRAMRTMAQVFGLPVGYSDHTLGIDVPIAAVALGATVIEKHFTLDRTMPGPDHLASLEPGELARMVAGIRTVESALGAETKQPAPQEIPNLPIARRSLVAARAISRGEKFESDMLVAKRPGTGISPLELWDLIGTAAVRDFAADEIISPMNAPIIVIGSGGHAAVLVDALLAAGATVLGLTDADAARHGAQVCGRPVIGDDTQLANYQAREVQLANGVGSTGSSAARRAVQSKLESAGWTFAMVRHPTAVVSPFAHVAQSAQLLAGSIVQPRAVVAGGCIVNTRAVVEHDVTLGDFTHVAPGAVICGDVRIGAGCHIGAGSVIRQGVTLGADTVIAAGAVVVRDHPGSAVLAGVPARILSRKS